MSKKVALHTLGCKLNFSETSTIGGDFLSRGFEIVEFNESADIYVFNTCTVTETAEKECRQLVRRALRQNPKAYVIVTGCYAQLRPDEIASIDGVDAVLGSNEKFKLFSLIDSFEKQEVSCIYVSPTNELNDFGPAHSTDADSRTRAYFKVQDGCDYNCSFCTIPLARGSSRSMELEKLVADFRSLIQQSYKEIILTGVNVGDYGKSTNNSFHDLLLRLVQVEGEFRLRVSSIEPNLLTDEIIELTASNEKMSKHFHIPLQSGSPEILKRMQRRYKVEDYRKLIDKLNSRIPGVGIGVDVIVGFPGETEEEFLQTYNFLSELEISYLHVFTYSERPDTKAMTMQNQINLAERRKRNKMLRILSVKKRHNFYEKMLGGEVEVLFESGVNGGFIKGFSPNYIRVVHPFEEKLINKLCRVQLTGIKDELCEGKILEIKNSVDLLAS
jgi:threonylcarbamoyladenosine tRNA methylthiotransferase MtaB